MILKGEDLEQIKQESAFLANLIQQEGQAKAACHLIVETGDPQQRIGDIHRSFTEALVKAKNAAARAHKVNTLDKFGQVEILKLENDALEDYLKFGTLQEIDDFFAAYLRSISDAILISEPVKHYWLMDIVLTVSQFVSDLGGDVEKIAPDSVDIENLLGKAITIEQLNEVLKELIAAALSYRDSQTNHQRSMLIQGAKDFIAANFGDPDLQMNSVAAKFNLSPSHFSTVFSQEVGETFRDYLNNLRIDRAKELLRTTSLKCSEIGFRCGYNDSHYFSTAFKKNTGVSPQQFRDQARIRHNQVTSKKNNNRDVGRASVSPEQKD